MEVDRKAKTEMGMQAAAAPEALSLVVMSSAGVFTYPLARPSERLLGRSDDADVPIQDARASRKHAELRVGAAVEIVDLASTNGTTVRDRRIEPNVPTAIAIGDTIGIGSTVLVVQRATKAAPAQVHGVEALDARIAEERARCERSGGTFALVALRVPDEPPARAERLGATLAECVRPGDVIAALGRGAWEILLCDVPEDRAEGIAASLRTRLDDEGFAARVGLALHPRDGSARASLESVAEASLADTERRPSTQLDTGAMARLQPLVDRVAAGMINVLVLGETGVGKEVMARTLHERSPRKAGPLVCINCAALSESLLESELFGHEKGAFTGALQAKPGLLESANGGTVFLDEIGEMPLTLQAKLLRVIEQREVQRVGSLKPKAIDVRFVAATNRDLQAEIARRRFREDLYFRLNGVPLVIPPLRERVEEIAPLARAFVEQACALSRRAPVPRITPPVLALLQRYAWPGNVRELRNVMERAVLLCDGDAITLEQVPLDRMGSAPVVPAGHRMTFPPGATHGFPAVEATVQIKDARALDALVGESERDRIVRALDSCHGNQTHAAKLLGISRRTLITRIEEYNLPRPRKRDA